MSNPFPVVIGGKSYQALPPSFAFQKANRTAMAALQGGTLSAVESQDFLAAYITHCVQRGTPGVNVAELEDGLDSIEIARASTAIGTETQRQVEAIYGGGPLGEVKAGGIAEFDFDGAIAEVCAWLKWTWSAAESDLDFPRWAALCRQREICPPVDVMVASYLGYKRPEREVPIVIDNAAEDAAFAAAMADFGAGEKHAFDVSDLTGAK